MWVITIFEQDSVRMFEYNNKAEATAALEKTTQTAILSYTR